MVFTDLDIWVQCHNVPLAFMHAPIISSIGDRIGRVFEVESGVEGRCKGMFARMKVSLDISKPLKQGVWVKSDNES